MEGYKAMEKDDKRTSPLFAVWKAAANMGEQRRKKR